MADEWRVQATEVRRRQERVPTFRRSGAEGRLFEGGCREIRKGALQEHARDHGQDPFFLYAGSDGE